MEINLFTGLYIFKGYDPYSDGIFKSIMQFMIEKNNTLSMNILNGPLKNISFGITYDELENNFIPISLFLKNATYIGYNALRILNKNDDIKDLNFTGYVDEETGTINKKNALLDNKLQIILYKDENNMLIYYDTDINKLSVDPNSHLRFVNCKYVLNNIWNLLDDCRDFYIDKIEIMNELYEMTDVKSKQMIIK